MNFISKHEPNSVWWNDAVGIIQSPEFFSLPEKSRLEMLSAYSWVEYKAPFESSEVSRISQHGFLLTDVQISFSINWEDATPAPIAPSYELVFADKTLFVVDYGVSRDFKAERFQALPGISWEKLDRRYVAWANQLIRENPEFALAVYFEGKIQGWCFGKPSEAGLEFTLAMLHRDAAIPGKLLYSLAFNAFREKGIRHIFSCFSVQNMATMNIFSKYNVHFKSPTGCWFWVNPERNR